MHIDDLKKRLDIYSVIWIGASAKDAITILNGVRKLPYTWAEYNIVSNENNFFVVANFRGGGEPQLGPKICLDLEVDRAQSFARGMQFFLDQKEPI